MKIPFLDLKVQYESIKNEIGVAIQKVLDNTAFALGQSVSDFEANFGKAHDVKNCSGVSSGTDGNHMVLWALGIGPEDEVIIPVNTFIATAWGATLCGAKPVFVDIDSRSYNIDAKSLLKSITTKTKAIVAVHLYGQPADMDAINEELISNDFELTGTGKYRKQKTGQEIYLVEDCAQSHIAEYKGRKVGGLGLASSFSFYPGKNLGAYGEGGAVCTNNDELGVKFKMLRDHGCRQKYVHEIYGHNYRMEGIQGAVLGVKLNYLNSWTEGRRKVAARYYDLLKNCDSIILPEEMYYSKHVYHLFVIQVKNGRRDELGKFLNDNGIATGLHYPIPLHLQPCFNHLGYKRGDFPITENLANRGLSLPMYAELTDEHILYIAEKVIEFFKSN
ncbi:MAG: DegT/DnrJ/EryC1/StrS family aminotransferase [Ignavibacteria bacterium]